MSNIRFWGVEETCEELIKIGHQCCEDRFKAKNITAKDVHRLTTDELVSQDIDEKHCKEILEHFRKLWQAKVPGKVFNDPIHGHLELHPLLVKIIDTPQFQRLRNIKQLGGAYFVFPGASHNRFEHSLGVAYLAGQFAEALSTKQPELNITPEDILCVQIAGLCHDLGQGPFSTVFEEMFIPEKRADLLDGSRKREEISVKMLDHLLSANNLHSSMKEYGLNVDGQNEKDLVFIKEMIRGHPNTDKGQFMGRTKDKYFLYEIVGNEKNGIDVDKFDYIARDSYYLGIQSSFDHCRCIMFARVCEVDGINHICFRDKEVSNLYSMFQTRSLLHRTAYQHKTTRIIEVMIKDALLQADERIQIEGSVGKIFNLSTAIDDMEAYTKLTDCVFEKILHASERPDLMIQMLKHELGTDPSFLFNDSSLSPTKENMETYKRMKENIIRETINASSKEMGDAKRLLLRIMSRQIYKCLGKMQSEKPTMPEIDTWKKELAQVGPPGDNQNVTVTANGFEIVHFTMDYGIKEKELIENIFFYKKNQPDKPFNLREDEVSMLLPKCSSEQFIRVYYKNIDEEVVETAQNHFDKWLSGKMQQ